MSNTIGKRLRIARENKRLQQTDVAKMLNMTSQTLSNYERGVRDVNTDVLQKLSEIYNVSFDWLFSSDEKKTTETKSAPEAGADKKSIELDKVLSKYEIMFDGTPMDDESKQDVLNFIRHVIHPKAKEINKRKKTTSKSEVDNV